MQFRILPESDTVELSFDDEDERGVVANWMEGGDATPADMVMIGQYGVGEWWSLSLKTFDSWKELAGRVDEDLFDVLPDLPDPDSACCAGLIGAS